MMIRYDDRLLFELPDGYSHLWGKADDSMQKLNIIAPCNNGEPDWSFSVVTASCNEQSSLIDRCKMLEPAICTKLGDDPEAVFYAYLTPPGEQLCGIAAAGFFVRKNSEKIYVLNTVALCEEIEHKASMAFAIEKAKQMVGFAQIDGMPLTVNAIDKESISAAYRHNDADIIDKDPSALCAEIEQEEYISSMPDSNSMKSPESAESNPIPQSHETVVSNSDCEIDCCGKLISYNVKSAEITLPDGIKTIGKEAFLKNNRIISVVIPDGAEAIEDHAFAYCSKLKNVELPYTLRQIGAHAFNTCNELTRMVIPEGTETIDACVFGGCEKLEEVELACSIRKIGANAFAYCKGLTHIEIPESTETIGKSAFFGCTNLTSAVIHGNTSEIADHTFAGCSHLNHIDLPYSIRRIGANAFSGCKRLPDIVIPEGTEQIADNAFSGCEKLKEIKLPSTLRKIGANAFEGCSELAQIVIPEGCETIGEKCFLSCNNLRDIYIPASVSDISENALRTYGNETVIHTAHGSTAESIAMKIGFTVDNMEVLSAKEAARIAEEERKQTEAAEAACRAEEERQQAEATEAARIAEEERQQAEAAEAARIAEEERKRAADIAWQETLNSLGTTTPAYQPKAASDRLNSVKKKAEAAVDPIAEERRRLLNERKRQRRIVENNKGLFALFGKRARRRKAAQAKIEQINKELARIKREKQPQQST